MSNNLAGQSQTTQTSLRLYLVSLPLLVRRSRYVRMATPEDLFEIFEKDYNHRYGNDLIYFFATTIHSMRSVRSRELEHFRPKVSAPRHLALRSVRTMCRGQAIAPKRRRVDEMELERQLYNKCFLLLTKTEL